MVVREYPVFLVSLLRNGKQTSKQTKNMIWGDICCNMKTGSGFGKKLKYMYVQRMIQQISITCSPLKEGMLIFFQICFCIFLSLSPMKWNPIDKVYVSPLLYHSPHSSDETTGLDNEHSCPISEFMKVSSLVLERWQLGTFFSVRLGWSHQWIWDPMA